MRFLTTIAMLAVSALCHAAGNGESFQLAQAASATAPAQKQGLGSAQKAAGKQAAKAPKPTPPAELSCIMDGRPVPDKATWCVEKSLRQCNASSSQWVNTGKRC